MARWWSDQPLITIMASELCNFRIPDCPRIQINKTGDGIYLVTVGNLFGSQTAKTKSPDTVFRLVQFVIASKGEDTIDFTKWPGLELAPNEETPEPAETGGTPVEEWH